MLIIKNSMSLPIWNLNYFSCPERVAYKWNKFVLLMLIITIPTSLSIWNLNHFPVQKGFHTKTYISSSCWYFLFLIPFLQSPILSSSWSFSLFEEKKKKWISLFFSWYSSFDSDQLPPVSRLSSWFLSQETTTISQRKEYWHFPVSFSHLLWAMTSKVHFVHPFP